MALYGTNLVTPLASGHSAIGPSGGEILLDYSGLTSGTTYTLQVYGTLASLANGSTGSFSGAAEVSPVPVPGALLLFASALIGLGGFAGRGRFKNLGSKLMHNAGRVAALVVGTGVAIGFLSSAGTADAATYTDNVVLSNALNPWVPTIPAGPQKFFSGVINTGKATPLSGGGGISSTVTGGPGTLTGFIYDFDFSLSGKATIDAILSQSHTTVSTPTSFELFGGSPTGSNTLLTASTVGTGNATGELQLHYANLAAGAYFLKIVGGLASGKTGTVTGLVSVSAVPVPAALLLFGSALAGLVGVGRRGRKTSV
jgi:hypothetical protein